jgi:hypothetical protein
LFTLKTQFLIENRLFTFSFQLFAAVTAKSSSFLLSAFCFQAFSSTFAVLLG